MLELTDPLIPKILSWPDRLNGTKRAPWGALRV